MVSIVRQKPRTDSPMLWLGRQHRDLSLEIVDLLPQGLDDIAEYHSFRLHRFIRVKDSKTKVPSYI
jgi:hypothetical protein